MEIKDILSIASLSLGIILSIVSIVTLIRTVRIKKTDGDRAVKEGLKALLRDRVEAIYYKNEADKSLREYERKNLDSLYHAYHDGLNGNSFVSDIYSEMREWKITR